MMAEVPGTYDLNEKTFEDEDGSRIRVTVFEEGHVVFRTSTGGSTYGGYVDLGPADLRILVAHLSSVLEGEG